MTRATQNQVALLRSALTTADVPVSEITSQLLADHLAFVLEANQLARLTAIESFEEGVRLHVLDSALALSEVLDCPPGRILDMGTGGGYPGVPLAVLSKRPVDLVDSVGKKARLVQEYLDSVPETLPDSRALPIRMERILEHLPQGGYAIALARALSSLPSLVELAAPALMVGGRLVALKGDLSDDELTRGDAAAEIVGLARISLRRYVLAGGNERRAVVVYERRTKSRVPIPRREGLAQRKPLA